jgi:DNA uptake protein ComE-like DNA-binding protein
MQIQSDHKALIFLGAVAVLGAGVRVVRAASTERPTAQPALEHQMASADSSARATGKRKSTAAQHGGGKGTRHVAAGPSSRDSSRKSPKDTTQQLNPPQVGPLDRAGYVGRKLDLDVATAAQIDSLPGVTPTMARRIAADRMRRGPFLNAQGLRRVSGVGPNFLREIDSLVTFSGTLKPLVGSDSVIEKPTKTRVPRSTKTMPPVALRRAVPLPGQLLRAIADSYSRARVQLALQPRAT